MIDAIKKEIESNYVKFKDFDGYDLSIEDYNEYEETGNRLNYESKYFAKRECLTARATYAYMNQKKADDDLIRIIESVCDEYSWVLPAHKKDNPYVDLYSAITGHTLCEIAHYIELPDALHKKIHDIVKMRIKEMYENNVSDWESYGNNWLPVCAGRIGMVYLYEFPEDFVKVKQRILDSMQKYIDGFGDDGACIEGVGYWKFGFGNYIYFAEMLNRIDGTDILSGDKVKEIAKFQQHMFIKKNTTISFSDSSRSNIFFDVGMTHYMKKKFGSDIKVPPMEYREKIEGSRDWAGIFRLLSWYDESILSDDEFFTNAGEEKYFADAKWYINRKNRFSFAAKAGHNQELHNHNDIGSFIITDGDQQLISDYGAGEYTKDYFTNDKRYKIFCCSSEGHSVPIIDGKYQAVGREFESEVIKAGDGEFCVEMSGAYDIDEVKDLRREFKIGDNSVSLTDRYEFATQNHTVTERFISVVKPEMVEECVKVGNMVIKADYPVKLTEQSISNHQGKKVTLYVIDYLLNGCEFNSEFVFVE